MFVVVVVVAVVILHDLPFINGVSLHLDPALLGSWPRDHLDRRGLWIAFLTIFGRTDLRISLSGAKFDAEADFGVRFAVAHQNPRQISEKRNFRSETFVEKKFSASKNETFGIV